MPVPTISQPTKRAPGDVEPGSLADLIADCRDMCAGALPVPEPVHKVVDLTQSLPHPRVPGTAAARTMIIDIRDSVVSLVDGISDYGA